MKAINGWDVYLKIKELNAVPTAQNEMSVNTLVEIFKGTDKELIREYMTALSILDFIKFTDDTKEIFILQEQ